MHDVCVQRLISQDHITFDENIRRRRSRAVKAVYADVGGKKSFLVDRSGSLGELGEDEGEGEEDLGGPIGEATEEATAAKGGAAGGNENESTKEGERAPHSGHLKQQQRRSGSIPVGGATAATTDDDAGEAEAVSCNDGTGCGAHPGAGLPHIHTTRSTLAGSTPFGKGSGGGGDKGRASSQLLQPTESPSAFVASRQPSTLWPGSPLAARTPLVRVMSKMGGAYPSHPHASIGVPPFPLHPHSPRACRAIPPPPLMSSHDC